MFTPQEVREQSMGFEKAIFGGYNMKSVDDFMAPMVEDYSALYKENAVLKSKMKVLVEKLEEYHEREDAMNKAILAAQKTADEMIVDTERKCAKMLSDTEETMRLRSQELKKEMAIEAERVNRAKKTAAAFILHVEEQMHKAVAQLEQVREMSITPKGEKPAPKAEPVPEEPTAPQAEPAAQETTEEPEITMAQADPVQAAQEIQVNIQNIIGGVPEDAEPMGSEAVIWDEEYPDDALASMPDWYQGRTLPQTSEDILGDTIVIHPIGQ